MKGLDPAYIAYQNVCRAGGEMIVNFAAVPVELRTRSLALIPPG
jgi:hypothetical protein